MDYPNTTLSSLPDNPESLSELTHALCGAVIILLSTFGFAMYVIFIMVVLKREKFHNSPFFIIAAWLGTADCLTLVVIITYAAPCVIVKNATFNKNIIMGGILNIAWFTSLPLILLLAFNRYLCICRTELCKKVYTIRNSIGYCVASWTFGIAYSMASFFECCPLYFEHDLMSWRWDTTKPGSKVLSTGEVTMVAVVTLGTFAFNACVIRTLHESRNTATTTLGVIRENRQLARERKVFFQFFITNIWLAIFDVPFITMGYLDDPSHWLGYFVTLTYIINCSINGWVYLTLNKTIQKELRAWMADIHVSCDTAWLHGRNIGNHGNGACTDSNISLSQIRVNGINPSNVVKSDVIM